MNNIDGIDINQVVAIFPSSFTEDLKMTTINYDFDALRQSVLERFPYPKDTETEHYFLKLSGEITLAEFDIQNEFYEVAEIDDSILKHFQEIGIHEFRFAHADSNNGLETHNNIVRFPFPSFSFYFSARDESSELVELEEIEVCRECGNRDSYDEVQFYQAFGYKQNGKRYVQVFEDLLSIQAHGIPSESHMSHVSRFILTSNPELLALYDLLPDIALISSQ